MLVPVSGPARQGEQGTVLIVVVAVLMLMSAIIVLGVGPFHMKDTGDKIAQTTHRQEFLIRELASYAQRANALPCPADPAVNPASREFGFARKNCDIYTSDGLIPFRTLNLSEHDARDAWGRFMSYKISPVLANTGAGKNIFMRCRRFPWFDGNPLPPAAQLNIFPEKARFCCPPDDGGFPPATDLQVFASAAAIPAGQTIDKIGRKGDPSYYGDIDKSVNIGAQGGLAPIPEAAGTEEMFAVAIVSHGRNGIGSWLGNGTAGRLTGPAGADEDANITGGNKVVTHPVNLVSGSSYYDDIVIWRTQISLMGELNNASCYAPWH